MNDPKPVPPGDAKPVLSVTSSVEDVTSVPRKGVDLVDDGPTVPRKGVTSGNLIASLASLFENFELVMPVL
jgi:hypothetical protein